MKTITITCENTGRDYHVAPGTTVGELQQIIHPENRYPVMGALVNNQLQDLQYVIMAPSRINYVDMTSLDGYSVNTRSLIFVLYKAVTQLYPRRLPLLMFIASFFTKISFPSGFRGCLIFCATFYICSFIVYNLLLIFLFPTVLPPVIFPRCTLPCIRP